MWATRTPTSHLGCQPPSLQEKLPFLALNNAAPPSHSHIKRIRIPSTSSLALPLATAVPPSYHSSLWIFFFPATYLKNEKWNKLKLRLNSWNKSVVRKEQLQFHSASFSNYSCKWDARVCNYSSNCTLFNLITCVSLLWVGVRKNETTSSSKSPALRQRSVSLRRAVLFVFLCVHRFLIVLMKIMHRHWVFCFL